MHSDPVSRFASAFSSSSKPPSFSAFSSPYPAAAPSTSFSALSTPASSMSSAKPSLHLLLPNLPQPPWAPDDRASVFPGDAREDNFLPLASHLFVADFDGDFKADLFVHSPGKSIGSCSQRCHARGRFGHDFLDLASKRVWDEDPIYRSDPSVHGKPYCLCGPTYSEMVAPMCARPPAPRAAHAFPQPSRLAWQAASVAS